MGQLDIFSLVGRVAIVAGGGGGIGSSLAEALAGAGAKVAVAGRARGGWGGAAGGGPRRARRAAELSPRSDWDWIMELTARSPVLPTQAVVRTMIEQGRDGRILNISSVRASLGINAGYSAYVAAKGAITSLTRQWATEWARYGIRVNAIMPTFVAPHQ